MPSSGQWGINMVLRWYSLGGFYWGNSEKRIRKWVLFGKRETIWATGFGILWGIKLGSDRENILGIYNGTKIVDKTSTL